MLSTHMQSAMLVLLLISIPLSFIWANAGNILQFLGQDPEISSSAGDYARFMELQHYCTCLSVGRVMVYQTNLEYNGAAIANAITYWINALLLFIYVRVSPSCKNTWTGFSKEVFHGIPTFLKLLIPLALMSSLEMWSFEMLLLVSGFLPNPELETSVLLISLNTCAMAYMIPFAFSGAAGAGEPRLAHLAAGVALCLVVSEGIIVAAGMIFGRKVWGYCYSSEKEVVNYAALMLIYVAVSHFFDGPQSVLSGVIRGSGQQKIGAYVNLGAYYLIGIPTGVLFAFSLHIGGKGLWIGIIVALFVQTLLLALIVTKTD